MNKEIWPYQIQLKLADRVKIYNWCTDQFSKVGSTDQLNWYYRAATSTWCFKDKKDFVLFCLRWT